MSEQIVESSKKPVLYRVDSKKDYSKIKIINKSGHPHIYYSSSTRTPGMPSLKELFRIGYGPSSSHTMGPNNAAKHFKEHYCEEANKITCILYGSLAATGKGHLTDVAIQKALKPLPVNFVWKPDEVLLFHVNGMTLESYKDEVKISSETYYSVGGGAIVIASDLSKINGEYQKTFTQVYNLSTMNSICKWCVRSGKTLSDYVYDSEGNGIHEYLEDCWKTMSNCLEIGLKTRGVIPGGLNLPRKAHSTFMKAQRSPPLSQRVSFLFAYALAVSENNASASEVMVTAPTCGACGVLPAVLYYCRHHIDHITDDDIIDALCVAGILGNITKVNASIAGAEAGCQAEIGTACAMAAGAYCFLNGGTSLQVENAAEIAMEHHLGLTCDPVKGLVQIPCIERNAMAACRAVDAAEYALMNDGTHIVSFDECVLTMYMTGQDIEDSLRETSKAGLAFTYNLDEIAYKKRIKDMKNTIAGRKRQDSLELTWGSHVSDSENENGSSRHNSDVDPSMLEDVMPDTYNLRNRYDSVIDLNDL
ncbi:hypothetical protein WA158_003428 [Blastocystis sp. Blastoise]